MIARESLNDNWIFYEHWSDELATAVGEGGTSVRLPHCMQTLPFHYFDPSIRAISGAYQRRLFIPKDYRGCHLRLVFEGVAHRVLAYVNGQEVGSHAGGYTPFVLDITEPAEPGSDNLIALRVESTIADLQTQFAGDWDELLFGGIYRDVYLEIRHPVHMTEVFYQPTLFEVPKTRGMSLDRLKSATQTGNIVTDIKLSGQGRSRLAQRRLSVCQYLDGKQISNQPLPENGRTVTLAGKVHLWDTASPHCYELRTELRLDGETVDVYTAKIGFRHIRWQTNGFFLNGRWLSVRGFNRRQAFPYVGYAMPGRMQQEDARILKQELGCNAVRSPYPPSEHFREGCDEQGLLLFVELPAASAAAQGEEGSRDIESRIAAEFEGTAKDAIRQGRNHPSVVLWGISHPVRRSMEAAGRTIEGDSPSLKCISDTVRKYDSTRAVAGPPVEGRSDFDEDVCAYEDYSYTGRGSVLTPKSLVTRDMAKPYLLAAYGGRLAAVSGMSEEMQHRQQLLFHAKALEAIAKKSEILGGFGESMCDYAAGGVRGASDGIAYYGVMDFFRNPKPAAGLYEAAPARGTVLRIVGDLFAAGEEAFLLTNAQKVRMSAAGEELAVFSAKDSPFHAMRHGPIPIHWQREDVRGSKVFFRLLERSFSKRAASRFEEEARLRYGRRLEEIEAAGGFRFEGMNREEVVAEISVRRSVRCHLEAEASHQRLEEKGGYDVAEVRIRALDEQGNLMLRCDEPLDIEAVGAIGRIGPGRISLRGGRGAFYVRSLGEAGKGAVRIRTAAAETIALGFVVDISGHDTSASRPDIM